MRRAVVGVVLGLFVAGALGAWAALAGPAGARLYRAALYPAVAQRVAAGANSSEEAALRVFDYVYEHVRYVENMDTPDDTAADILLRGFGYCDQSVIVLVQLLQTLDIPARMTYLRESGGNSPHSVAEVFLDGDWRMFDVANGWTPRRADGEFATIADLVDTPDLLAPTRSKAEWFEHAYTVTVLPPSPLRALAEGTLNRVVALAPQGLMDLAQDLYLVRPPEPTETATPDAAETGSPGSDLYRRARHYTVLMRYDEAAAVLAQMETQYAEVPLADDAAYLEGFVALGREDEEVAVAELTEVLEMEPRSLWLDDALYFEARALEASGACEEAADAYRTVARRTSNGTEDARSRLGTLPCTGARTG